MAARRTKFKANITVSNEPVPFSEILIGGLFVRADATTGMSMGGSNIWVGFDIYVKISSTRANNTASEREVNLDASLSVLEIDIDSIDRPIQKEVK